MILTASDVASLSKSLSLWEVGEYICAGQVVFPLHLFATFCFFYVFYFVAKSLVTVNKRKEVFIGDYAKSWILLCLFPIGVWFIQPRINQLYTEAMSR